ncbi:unnamed protein product, partial [Tetraodon nigroviridis]
FKVCISMQRCAFLLHPFTARRWRRRYDLLISILVWVVVSLGCSPFILMRSSGISPSNVMQAVYNVCFKDLPMRRLSVSTAIPLMFFAELLGFLIPLACISYSSILITRSLKRQTCNRHNSLSASACSRSHSLSIQSDSYRGNQTDMEKQRALKMVVSCFVLFLVCFAPYHINFLLYLMVSQGILSHCPTELAVRQFHPLSLCLASLSCCLNPVLYYFLTAEFRLHLSRR